MCSSAKTAKSEAVQISGESGVTGCGSKAGEALLGEAPTRAQLRTLFMHSAVPMVGFGEPSRGLDALDSSWWECLENIQSTLMFVHLTSIDLIL